MGTYRYALCGPSTIFLATVDGERVPILPARYAYKPFWSDEAENRRMHARYVKPTIAAWKRTSVAKPAYVCIVGDSGKGKGPSEGDEVRSLPPSFTAASWLDEPDGHIGTRVGFLWKTRSGGTNRWVVYSVRREA